MVHLPEVLSGGGELHHPLKIPPDQREFMSRLNLVNERHVKDLPDLQNVIDHDGQLGVIDEDGQQTAYEAAVENLTSLHLDSASLAPFVEAGQNLSSVTFQPKPLMRLGRENSKRHAFFGALSMASGSGEVTENVDVVVKQFPLEDAVNAIQECGVLKYVEGLGLPTIDLVGVLMHRYRFEGPLIYVLVKHRPDLESLDEQDWRNIRVEELDERLKPVIATLMDLHTNLVFHGDPEFKNIAVSEEADSHILFDFDHSRSARDLVARIDEIGEEGVLDELTKLLDRDFDHVFVSLEETVFPNLPPPQRPIMREQQFALALNHIFEPYQHALAASDSPHKELLDKAYRRMLERQRRITIGGEQRLT